MRTETLLAALGAASTAAVAADTSQPPATSDAPRATAPSLFLVAAIPVLITLGIAAAGRHANATEWQDPSHHKVSFVDAAPGVRLEVLDWGGRGAAMLLLAGSGGTAHIYDEFAPKLTDLRHVYGVTRRGFGASDRAASGYDDQRLADDVVAIIGKTGMSKPVLVGHSAAGNEMTTVASQHPDLAAALVYLDAAADPKDLPIQDAHMRELFARTPAWYRGEIQPTSAESKTFDGFAAFQRRQLGFAFPESELRQLFATNTDGSRGRYLGSLDAGRQMGEGTVKRDYRRIHVPILAFFAGEPPARAPGDAGERTAIDDYQKAKEKFIERWKRELREARGRVRIIDLPDANHFVFLSNEAEVLREIRAFLRASV
jgi:pimeloyl-ACP methyl ester carboxylesterase